MTDQERQSIRKAIGYTGAVRLLLIAYLMKLAEWIGKPFGAELLVNMKINHPEV